MELYNKLISILLHVIIDQYFTETKCLFIFSDHNFSFRYQGALPVVSKTVAPNSIMSFSSIFHSFGCEGVIIFSKSVELIFKQFENEIRYNTNERFNNRRYLIVPLFANGQNDVAEHNFFSLPELDFVCDLLFVISENGELIKPPLGQKGEKENIVFNLKTHKYIGTENQTQPILVDKWFSNNQTFLYGNNLFPNKITNQMGRPIKMATFTYEPYVILDEGTQVPKKHYGTELLAMTHFARLHNMTETLLVIENDYWGAIWQNWSGKGLLGNLVADGADLGFAALYAWEYCYSYLDFSKPLVRTGITCLVPAPKLSTGWLTPLFSYTPELWIYVIITCTVSILILIILSHCYDFNQTLRKSYHKKRLRWNVSYFSKYSGLAMIQVGKPLLSQSLTQWQLPEEMANKLLNNFLLILGLFITSTYSSGLASIMTIPRYDNPINTVDDFWRSGLLWGGTQDAWTFSLQTLKEKKYVDIVKRFREGTEETLYEYFKSGQFAFPIERLPFDNFAIGAYIRDDNIQNYRLMEDDIYWEQCVIMTRKNSVLLPALDLFVSRIFEAGLVSKWQNQAVALFMDFNVQAAVKYFIHNSQQAVVVKLKWTHVEGAFAILIMGCCASVIVFLGEKIWFKCRSPPPFVHK